MADSSTAIPGGVELADDQGNPTTFARIVPNDGIPGWADVQLLRSGVVVATPVRLKLSNSAGRIAADFPGCDSSICVVDGNGSITNG